MSYYPLRWLGSKLTRAVMKPNAYILLVNVYVDFSDVNCQHM
jgi:hypothetical protein